MSNSSELVVREVIYLDDPNYFCNKSWTLSFNMNTKSWTSFHSYIPNFYIAENNFFYSGLNGGCDLDLIAAQIVPTPSTTSTSTTIIPPEPLCQLVGTATRIAECDLDGIADRVEDCTLYGYANGTTTTTTTIPPIPCSSAASYSGGESYPTTQTVTLGEDVGSVSFDFEAFTVPDRFIVLWNSTVVIDTGYRGGSNYDFGGANRASFNSSLTGDIDPITLIAYPDFVNYPDDGYPRVTSPGSGTTSFNKTLASPTLATVNVYAPMSGTQWEFTLYCPVTTTTTTTLPPS